MIASKRVYTPCGPRGLRHGMYRRSRLEITAGAGEFSPRKNETSKCCDISFEILMVTNSRRSKCKGNDWNREEIGQSLLTTAKFVGFTIKRNPDSFCCGQKTSSCVIHPFSPVSVWPEIAAYQECEIVPYSFGVRNRAGKTEGKRRFPRSKEIGCHSQKRSCLVCKRALNSTSFSLCFLYPIFATYKGKEKSQHFQNTFFRPEKELAPGVNVTSYHVNSNDKHLFFALSPPRLGMGKLYSWAVHAVRKKNVFGHPHPTTTAWAEWIHGTGQAVKPRKQENGNPSTRHSTTVIGLTAHA
ncbi:hypothetical protein DFS33DRAFT_999055 [Desarmillaria ectypa]|nr:hypothetical protein DFS33DRAFT_999055 [Desarmillaria ectypa]